MELAHVLADACRVVALGVDADEDRAHLVPVLLLCARAACVRAHKRWCFVTGS